MPGLPKAIVEVLRREAPEEQPLHAVPADLDAESQYQDGFLIITDQRVLTIVGDHISGSYERSDNDRFVTNVMTGSGTFIVLGQYGNRALAYFSRRHGEQYQILVRHLGATYRLQHQNSEMGPDDQRHRAKWESFAQDWVAEPLRSSPRSVLMRLLSYLKPYRWGLIWTLLLFVIANLLLLAVPQLTRVLIDNWLVQGVIKLRPVATIVGAMASVYVLRSATVVLRNRSVARLGSRLVYDLRSTVYQSVQAMSLRFIAGKPSGDILNRVARDTINLRRFLQSWGTDGISYVLMFILLCTVAFVQNWLLAVLTIATIPLAVVIALVVWRLARWMERTHHRLNDKIGSLVHDVLAGIRVVKAFRRGDAEISRYEKWITRKYDIDVRNQKIWRTMAPIQEFALRLGEVLMFLVGGMLVIRGQLQIGELVQFATYAVMLAEPLAWMGELPQRIIEALTSAERIFEAIDQEPDIVCADRPVVQEIRGNVRFRDVEFSYQSGEPVIRELSLDISAGEMIGLVGPSGAGKSTFINLLLRLYDVNGGQIDLDGVDIRLLDLASLRKQVGVVLQDSFLFAGSVAENIRYAQPAATDDQVVEAAEIAQAHDFIMHFSDGYDTQVGERGQRLSGGERQRVSIARAILHDPKILILDEATSALDLETEERIHSGLAALTSGRTVIAIAHRLATLRRANRLVVMEGGRIVEMGTHSALMDARGRYRSMVEAQRALSDARTLSST